MPDKTFRFFIFVAILAVGWYLGRFFDVDVEGMQRTLLQYPIGISAVLFIGLYVWVTFFVWFVAKDVFRISSAVIFGPYISTLLVWAAETVNAAILFTISRKLGRGFVEQRFKVKREDIDKMKKDSGFWGILAIRINPLVPFRFMDIGFGLSQVSFRKYMGIVFFASVPRIFWLQYILADVGANVFKDPQAVTDYLMAHQFVVVYSMLYFLAVCIFTAIAVAVKFFNKTEKDGR